MSMAAKGVVLGMLAVVCACGQDPMEAPAARGLAARQAGVMGDGSRAEQREVRRVLDAALAGVPRPYTGAVNAIRGVPGGGLPWVLGEGRARLRADGVLKVEVEGLVFDPADAAVIQRGIGGTNTVAQAKAIVSCLTIQDGAAVTVNVSSSPVDFTLGAAEAGGGNATIEEQLQLPSPCLAPIVFVTSPGGAWFAATGW